MLGISLILLSQHQIDHIVAPRGMYKEASPEHKRLVSGMLDKVVGQGVLIQSLKFEKVNKDSSFELLIRLDTAEKSFKYDLLAKFDSKGKGIWNSEILKQLPNVTSEVKEVEKLALKWAKTAILYHSMEDKAFTLDILNIARTPSEPFYGWVIINYDSKKNFTDSFFIDPKGKIISFFRD